MAYHLVTIEETGETFRCSDQESLLVGMEKLGKRGIPVGCRGGGCGVCKIQIVSGAIKKRVMSREHISVADEAAGRVLACRSKPTSDVVLRVVGLMKKNILRND
ncbi:Ferredoxin [Georgfuchsia toluolica]|uniref:Ferredoxin n=1 Tax=Georgfuchsia toluolica TaxID=424218 RepID=A0A916J8I2_9PROT|nr:2Fe-2S iron-sulfur cluster-binding protein [Georgfuchsia toluolica]CAG4885421.1 Ferredoxin [Georgfuchsia toluolica]CAG4885435.1 Ferredoxin [Georgfuchsia toluolica]